MAQESSTNPSQTIQCQRCDEFIKASLINCPFCGAIISQDNTEADDNLQSRRRQARSEAYFLKIAAHALAGFFLAVLLSFFEGIGLPGFLLLLIALPMLLIRWWVKYRGLQMEDGDGSARRDVLFATVIWCGVMTIWFGASLIESLLRMGR